MDSLEYSQQHRRPATVFRPSLRLKFRSVKHNANDGQVTVFRARQKHHYHRVVFHKRPRSAHTSNSIHNLLLKTSPLWHNGVDDLGRPALVSSTWPPALTYRRQKTSEWEDEPEDLSEFVPGPAGATNLEECFIWDDLNSCFTITTLTSVPPGTLLISASQDMVLDYINGDRLSRDNAHFAREVMGSQYAGGATVTDKIEEETSALEVVDSDTKRDSKVLDAKGSEEDADKKSAPKKIVTASVLVPHTQATDIFGTLQTATAGYHWRNGIEATTGRYTLTETPPLMLVMLLDYIHGGEMAVKYPRVKPEGHEYIYSSAQKLGYGTFIVDHGENLEDQTTMFMADRLVQMFKIADYLKAYDLCNQIMNSIIERYNWNYHPVGEGWVSRIPLYNARWIFDSIPFHGNAPLHKMVLDHLYYALTGGPEGTFKMAIRKGLLTTDMVVELLDRHLQEDRGLDWPWHKLVKDPCRYHDHSREEDDFECNDSDALELRGVDRVQE